MSYRFPFSAIVGQDDMKLALQLAAIDASIGGVLVFGDRGTGKSTSVRALAALLPKMRMVVDCPYNCDPQQVAGLCRQCGLREADAAAPKSTMQPVPVVDLPLGATEDRVVGALDLEKALVHGEKHFEPGLLARANRGFLYVDEVNLLEDHLVDLLIDVAASGENVVEREGLSVQHPAKFVLVGSGNPEEGELRPQLLDRFGLSVEVKTPEDIDQRMLVVQRRDEFERNTEAFMQRWKRHQGKVRSAITAARKRLPDVKLHDDLLRQAAELCIHLKIDGLRGELTLVRAARARAALRSSEQAQLQHMLDIAPMTLHHRLRRNPLDESGAMTRVRRAMQELFD